MARLWQCGFELNTLTAGVEFDSSSSSGVSLDTSIKHGGAYSWRVNSSSSRNAQQAIYASDTSAHIYIRFYLYIASAPAASIGIFGFRTSAGNINLRLRLTSARKLQMFKTDNTQLGSDTAALNTAQWYRIEIKNDASTSPGTLDVRVDGSSVISGSDSSQSSTRDIIWGTLNGSATDLYFDDIAVNDTNGSFQTSWPGEGQIVHLKPDSAGDSNGYLVTNGGTAGASNNFTRVQEITPDDATTYNASVLLNAEDLYNCDASSIGASDVVNTVMVGARFADLVAADATTAFKLEIEKTSAGTKSQSPAIIANSTTWRSNAIALPFLYPLVTYQDPDGSNWTQTTLDSMQIGMIVTAAGVRTAAISKIWASVDYTPNAGGGTTVQDIIQPGLIPFAR